MFQQINRLPKAFKNALLFLLIAAFFTLGAAAAEALVIEGSVLSSIDVGKTYQATVKDLRIDENNVRYKSSDTSIIKIGKKDGKITPVAPGKATLTAYNVTNNKSLCNRTITVYLRTESIEVFPQRLYLYTSKPFNSFAFTVMKKFPENSTDTITPQSDNKDIAGAGALSTNISAGDVGKTTIRFYARRTRASSIDSEYSTLMSSTIEVFVHEHNTYSTKWTAADSFYHYRACDKDDCPLFRIGTEMDYEEHDFSSYGICRRCRYYKAAKEKDHEHTFNVLTTDETGHFWKCSDADCGATKHYGRHEFKDGNICKVCGHTHEHDAWKTGVTVSPDGHWFACSESGCKARKDYTEHTAENESTATCLENLVCTVCGMTFGQGKHGEFAWTTSENYHTYKCTVCGYWDRDAGSMHVFEYATAETMNCKVCGYVHTHTFGDWQSSATEHWKDCTKLYRDSNGKIAQAEYGEKTPHTFDKTGVCTQCGYQKELTAEDGVYLIYDLADLWLFAAKVNGDEPSANARLMADIDFESQRWMPMGSADKPYTGTFDGGGKALTNFCVAATENNTGLFGVVNGGTVKNFSLDGGIIVNTADKIHIGSVAGAAKGGAVFSGIESSVAITGNAVVAKHVGGIVGSSQFGSGGLLLEKCTFSGNISVQRSDDCIGGILGYANYGVTIRDCASAGQVSGKPGALHVGGILGYINSASFGGLTGCYATGKISSGFGIGYIRNCAANTVYNNCHMAGTAAYGGERASLCTASAVTEADFASGRLTWLLNGAANNGTGTWKQTIGTGERPQFEGGTVYRKDKSSYTNNPDECHAFICAENGVVQVSNVTKPCLLVFTRYDNGRFYAMITSKITENCEIPYKDYGLLPATAERVYKLYLWEDLQNAKPLCEAEICS